MKHLTVHAACQRLMLAGIGMLLLTACAKTVVDEALDETGRPANSQLKIVTRAGDADTPDVPSGRIYVMGEDGKCVAMLTTDEDTQSATAKLSAGSYDIYTVGGFDIAERITLPAQAEATAQSELQQASSNLAMDDLLMKHTTVTLDDGEDQQLTITLARMVLRIDQITINNVPDNVSAVAVTLSPFHKKVRLDGTYTDDTEPIAVSLENTEGQTWQMPAANKETYHFPSKGEPTITIKFTTTEGTKSFSYTAAEELPANHKVTLEGTYTQKQGVNLEGILEGTGWGEDKRITFDFDDNNVTENTIPSQSMPNVGEIYNGCTVIAVEGNTVTLLSPDWQSGFETDSDDQAESLDMLNTCLSTWSTKIDIDGDWRLPTVAEAQFFLADKSLTFVNSGENVRFYCLDNGVLKCIRVNYGNGDTWTLGTPTTSGFGIGVRLRPVMDEVVP